MATLQTRRCQCGEDYDVLTQAGESVLMADVEDDGYLRCVACGETDFRVIIKRSSHGHTRGVEDTLYPYFNRGLGMWLESKEHKNRVLKEKGLVEAPGLDLAAEELENAKFYEQNAREYNDYVEEIEGDSIHADWRRERDLEGLGR